MGIFPQIYSNVCCKKYALTFRNAEAMEISNRALHL